MSELRLGVEIGFKKISLALYENGVPRVIFSFPSSAACSIDRSEWHFGMNAGSFLADTHYQHVPSVKHALLSHNDGRKNPLVPLLLEQLFAHIKMIGENKLKQCLQGVVVVLPQCLNCSPVNRQMVMDAWQKNGIMDVLCISDVSAILLAYTVQTLDRRSIITKASEPFYLLVCNADSERCRVDFFVVISNNYVIKIHNNCVLWGCFADLRRRVVAAIYERLLSAGMPEVNQRAQLEEECWSQMAVFDDSLTDKVTIRAPFHQYAVTCTRGMYHAVAAPVIDAIRQRVVSELGRFGIMDANTGNINGKVELLLVGENSRLGLLRTALESATKSQVIAGAESYGDDAEAFGAAIASSLAGNRENTLINHLLVNLREGIAFDMEKILTALPLPHADNDLAQSEWNRFIGRLHDVSLTGDLYMRYREIQLSSPAFA
ncbi:uncharacterized protein LOC129584317 [Paramacrobiotus metropolitanus]|uniref:uncharacterized protein LOC129584317 n=1 Tax=Paramacrobiotus metropolitanus TaxID=2943436 RepID=UPI0024464FA5|nr:uncharacterized protein LOC129584317 [Paramacrobiotus metropolitanus]XP_055332439.1 uncharacterized protein LOC129584317 [Paramacrobiotus metropolitanus]